MINLILIISLFFSGFIQPKTEDIKTLEIGASAPDFRLPAIDGKTYSLKDFESAKILAIVFTANHCPTAQAYERRIINLAADYKNKGVTLIAVGSNNPQAVCLEELGYSDLGDNIDEMKIRAVNAKYNFVYLYDGEKQEMAKAYGPQATPHIFIFDKSRKLRYTGRIDDTENPYIKPPQQDARNAIEALLAGKKVPVEKTKVFGCSMKWASKIEWRRKLDAEWNEKPVSVEGIDSSGVVSLVKNTGNKYRLINVWATWCGPCIIEFPEFVVMQRMYGKRDFEVVSISSDKPAIKEKVLQFLQDNHAAFKNYHFQSENPYSLISAIDKSWEGNLPYTMLVSPKGEIVYRHSGIIDPLEVKQEIVRHLGRYYADDK
jgi:thiol-disulfide isomerase/thioredoxin